MGYDIPPPLQHKEKIIFGMTFSQLAYAFPAFLLIFLILKSGIKIEFSGALSIFVALISAFFMFFDGKNRIKNVYNYLKNQKVEVLSKELKQIIDIKKIENNEIIQSKSKLAIIEVIPMNFMLKPDDEKESIMLGFQKFLNSLDFPVHIHITSTNINLTRHFTYTEKQVQNKIKEIKQGANYLNDLFTSYQEFIKELITKNSILNRNFYIIMREKDNLDMQVKVCEEKLKALGLKVKRLENNKIIETLHSYIAHNKEKEAKNEEIKDLGHFIFSPEKILFYPDNFKVENTFYKVVAVTGYPHSVEMGFLDKIISSGDRYDISIHIQPYPIEDTMIQLNRDLQKQQADLYADSKKGILNPSLEIKFNSTKKVLEDLQKGKQKLFDVSLYILCKSETEKEVKLLAKKVKADLDGLMIQSKVPSFQSMESYTSTLPLANNKLKIDRNIHTEGLAAFFPFSSPFLDIEDDGILLGLNKNKIPYIKNIFNLANYNGVVLASSGAGKSYFVKLMLSRQFMNGCDIIIIDPQGEYLEITGHYKGETVTISKNSKTIINPLDLMGHDYLEKRLSLMDLFRIMLGDINELQQSILDKAIDLTYENSGITRDDYESHQPPVMSDLFKTLLELEKRSVRQEKVTYRALMNRIQMYTERGVFGFLDKQTKLNFDNNFVCFNIGDMPKQVKPVIMYLILDFVFMRMKNNKRRKLLVIDEAWSILQTAEESSYVFEIVKTCRKFNLGLLMITQDVADLVGSKAGHAVLANTAYTFLLRQRPAVMGNVMKVFNLSKTERDYLVSANLGHGILILENEHQELEVVSSPEEHRLITTNPNEAIKKAENKEPSESNVKKIDEKAGLDLSKNVIEAKGLTILQMNVLNNHGYILKKAHNLESGPHSYYIKPRYPESAEHTFLVSVILDEITKYTDKVNTYQTREADIIFDNKAELKIALEIETGKGLRKHKGRLDEKFELFRKKYGKRAYLILTDNDLFNSYKKYNINILLRKDLKEFIKTQFSPV